MFYLSKKTFDDVPVSIASHLKSEAESLQRGFEVVRSVDEERGLLDLLFLAEFTKRQHGELRGPDLEQPHMEIRWYRYRLRRTASGALSSESGLYYLDPAYLCTDT